MKIILIILIGLSSFAFGVLPALELYAPLAESAVKFADKPGQVHVANESLGEIKVSGGYIFIRPPDENSWAFWGTGHGVALSPKFPESIYIYIGNTGYGDIFQVSPRIGNYEGPIFQNVECTNRFFVLEESATIVTVWEPTANADGGRYRVTVYGKQYGLREGKVLAEGRWLQSLEPELNDAGYPVALQAKDPERGEYTIDLSEYVKKSAEPEE